MTTREEKIAFIQSKLAEQAQASSGSNPDQPVEPTSGPMTREQKIQFIQQKIAEKESQSEKDLGFFETIDSYTGAPTRAAISAAQNAKNPMTAFAAQFGEDPASAATGKEIATKAGLSTDEKLVNTGEQRQSFDEKFNPGLAAAMKKTGTQYQDQRAVSPAGAAGLAIDVVADPINIVPFGMVAKGAKRGAKAASEAPGIRNVAKAFQSQKATATAEAGAKAGAYIKGGDLQVEQGGKLFSVEAPKSLDELRSWRPTGNPGELPGKGRLKQIESVVTDLETKPLKYHYDMMENPKAMKDLKLQFENLPTKDAKQIAAYNQQIVEESGRKVADTVSGYAPSAKRSLTEAGDDLILTVKEKYNAEKEALGPAFEQLRNSSRRASRAETMNMAQAIGAETKLGKLMQVSPETGRISLAKNTPRSGISDAEHSLLSRVIDDMNDGMTFKEVQDTRAFLRKAIDPANPAASEEILKVNSILLGQLENMAKVDAPGVYDTFKAYAKNERAREAFEKIVGGKIESLDAMFAANPERAIQKVFANPNHAKVVAEYVGPEKMRELVGSYLHQGLKGVYDSATGYSPVKLRQWLKTNSKFVETYVDPQTAQRLHALADYGYYGKRFLDEVNPSGTAASLLSAVKPEGFLQKVSQRGIIGAVESETIGRVGAKIKQRQATRALNESLGGTNTKPTSVIKQKFANAPSAEQVMKKAQSAARSVTAGRTANLQATSVAVSAENKMQEKKGEEKWAEDGFKKLLDHSKDPEQKAALERGKSAMTKNPKLKQLLIYASDLTPGSKSMDKILEQIKAEQSRGPARED